MPVSERASERASGPAWPVWVEPWVDILSHRMRAAPHSFGAMEEPIYASLTPSCCGHILSLVTIFPQLGYDLEQDPGAGARPTAHLTAELSPPINQEASVPKVRFRRFQFR